MVNPAWNAVGTSPPSLMPALSLSDDDIASVLTYVRNSWGNKADLVQDSEVAKLRAAGGIGH